MKLFLFILWSSIVLFASDPFVIKAHRSAHRIKTLKLEGGTDGFCSATSIGPHSILTASHCIGISAIIPVDNTDAEVMAIMSDGLDHSIVLLRGVTFKEYTDLAEVSSQQADEVFVFGNPAGFQDIYRKGYVAGFKTPEDVPDTPLAILSKSRPKDTNTRVKITYYDFNGFFGDSGSAIYNVGGKIVGVVSDIVFEGRDAVYLKFMSSYELRFSNEQILTAKDYVPPVLPDAPIDNHKSLWDTFLGK